MRFFLNLSLLFAFTTLAFSAKIGLITGSTKSVDFQIINQYLSKDKIKTSVFDLSKLKNLPYNELFSFRKHAIIRLIEKDLPNSYMSLEEADFWLDYLSAGGSLILIANHLGPSQIHQSRLLEYVGFSTKEAQFSSQKVQGKTNGLIANGMKLDLNQNSIHQFIVPHKNSGVEAIFWYDNDQVAAIKQQSCAFRMSYFSFLPSWISDQKKQSKLLE
ncbi:hypothetical protein MJH12_16585, partial [bacterium]|nr:hypothetical protein [bacterium]